MAGVQRLLRDDPKLVDATETDPPFAGELTALHLALVGDHSDVAAYLVSHGARLDVRNGDGQTALHYAAASGDLPVIRMMLVKGADVNAKDTSGATPLDLSLIHICMRMVLL